MQVHGEHSQHYVIALDRNSKSADVQDFRDGKLYATYSQLAITRDNAYGYPPMEFSLPASAATPWTIPQLSSLPVTVQIFDSVSPATVGIAEGPLNPDDGGCARQL